MTTTVSNSQQSVGATNRKQPFVKPARFKDFSQSDHDRNDMRARETMLGHLREMRPDLQHQANEDRYGIDMLSLNQDGEVVMSYELECREGVWRGGAFPYRTVHIPARKGSNQEIDLKKLKDKFKLHPSYRSFIVQFSGDFRQMMILDAAVLHKYEAKLIRINTTVTTDEEFYNIPIWEWAIRNVVGVCPNH